MTNPLDKYLNQDYIKSYMRDLGYSREEATRIVRYETYNKPEPYHPLLRIHHEARDNAKRPSLDFYDSWDYTGDHVSYSDD